MKKSIIIGYTSIILGGLLTIGIIASYFIFMSNTFDYIEITEQLDKEIKEEIKIIEEKNFSDQFILALAKIESNNNPAALNKCTNAAGLLQITPIYVKEINKYSKIQYTLSDRFDSIKNIEMFKLFNKIHNPSFDIDRAIFLHNPKANNNYRLSILKQIKI